MVSKGLCVQVLHAIKSKINSKQTRYILTLKIDKYVSSRMIYLLDYFHFDYKAKKSFPLFILFLQNFASFCNFIIQLSSGIIFFWIKKISVFFSDNFSSLFTAEAKWDTFLFKTNLFKATEF